MRVDQLRYGQWVVKDSGDALVYFGGTKEMCENYIEKAEK